MLTEGVPAAGGGGGGAASQASEVNLISADAANLLEGSFWFIRTAEYVPIIAAAVALLMQSSVCRAGSKSMSLDCSVNPGQDLGASTGY